MDPNFTAHNELETKLVAANTLIGIDKPCDQSRLLEAASGALLDGRVANKEGRDR